MFFARLFPTTVRRIKYNAMVYILKNESNLAEERLLDSKKELNTFHMELSQFKTSQEQPFNEREKALLVFIDKLEKILKTISRYENEFTATLIKLNVLQEFY